AQGVVGEASFGLNGFDGGAGGLGQLAFFVQGQIKAETIGVYQVVVAAAVGDAVVDLADGGYVGAGVVGVDVAGQAFAGDGFYYAVVHGGFYVYQAGWGFEFEVLFAFLFLDYAGFQYGGGGADGVGAGVDGVAHDFHDDVTGGGFGVGGGYQQVNGHFRNAIGLFQQQPPQAVGVVAQVFHLGPYRISRQVDDAACDDSADVTAGMGVHQLN